MLSMREHFTYRKLLRFTFPSAVMMVFTSIYGVVDGLFLSNFAGKTAFAAVNFILPYLMLLGGIGFMFGSGGSALVAKTLGEQDIPKANRIFTSLVITSLISGVVLGIAGYLFLRPVSYWMGARGQLLEDSVLYGRIYLLGVPFCVVQYEFQNLYSTAGKPKLGLYSTVASGVTNIVLDALFVGAFSWGLVGAAAATVLSQVLGGLLPLIYFGRENSSMLRLTRSSFDGKSMVKVCTNGASELLNNISMTIVSILYNVQLLRYAGNDGLAAYGVLMYVNFLFISVFLGYSLGVSPIISYHYGAENHKELRSLLRKSLVILGSCSLMMFVISELSAGPVSRLFVGYDPELLSMTLRGFLLFSFCFLFAGMGIFSSAFFTALNNGLISAILSGMRTMVFQIAFVLLLPLFWDIDGIWLSVVAAELLAALLGMALIFLKRKAYHYA